MSNQSNLQTGQPGIKSALLLLGVGVLIALMLPLSRAAMDDGMTPLAYAFWQALGGGVILAALPRRRSSVRFDGSLVRYFGISGLTAIAVPNAVAFAVVSKVGAGLTATLYALPSLATYAIAVALGMDAMRKKKAIGLSFGVAGCVWILSPNPVGISSKHFRGYWSVCSYRYPWLSVTSIALHIGQRVPHLSSWLLGCSWVALSLYSSLL